MLNLVIALLLMHFCHTTSSTSCAELLNHSLKNIHVSGKNNFQLVLAKFSDISNCLELELGWMKGSSPTFCICCCLGSLCHNWLFQAEASDHFFNQPETRNKNAQLLVSLNTK